jgi:hypothetical protein
MPSSVEGPLNSAYLVLIPKAAITDIENLREAAWALARTWAFNQSDHWDTDQGKEIAFGFENDNVAVVFQAHCRRRGIPSRLQRRNGVSTKSPS